MPHFSPAHHGFHPRFPWQQNMVHKHTQKRKAMDKIKSVKGLDEHDQEMLAANQVERDNLAKEISEMKSRSVRKFCTTHIDVCGDYFRTLHLVCSYNSSVLSLLRVFCVVVF